MSAPYGTSSSRSRASRSRSRGSTSSPSRATRTGSSRASPSRKNEIGRELAMHFAKARGRAASRSGERRRIGVASAALTAGLVLAGALVSADDLVQARIVEVHADTVKLGRGTEAGVREKQVYDIFGDSPNAYALPLTGGA